MSDGTLIEVQGHDTLDLLHRISTQALLDLTPGETRVAAFCDFRGRLQHRVWVARTGTAVWLTRPDATSGALIAFLDRCIFREDVRMTDRSADVEVTWIEPGSFAVSSVVDRNGRPARLRAARGPGLDVTGRDETVAMDVRPFDERARIRAGEPAHGHEIVDDFTPFEVNLGDALHLDKGCFTGQETLQRLVTHDSVRRRLFRVGGDGEPPSVPSDVLREGTAVGRLTSASAGDADRWVGLAVLRRELRDATGLTLESGDALRRIEPVPLARPLGRPWAAED